MDSRPSLISFLLPPFSLPNVLCDPTDLNWRKITPFEAMIGRTASSSDGLLAEFFLGLSSTVRISVRRSVHSPQDHLIIILIISDRRD